MEDIIKYVLRGTVEVFTEQDLREKFDESKQNNKKLVIKYGVDPTAPEIHLGHMVPLRKLRHFQDVGQDITFLIGDFTARIGDPSGRSKERKPMSEKEVLDNAKKYEEQIFKILIPNQTRIVYNSSWLKNLRLEEVIELLAKNTVNNLIKRKSFVKRIEAGNPIAGHELIYPFLQAYDSVALNADIEIGGTDQYFNLLFGRDLQPRYGQKPQVVITTPLLEGLDGNEKMSKSLGNTVGINESAYDMYKKIMTVKDGFVNKYFELLTNVDMEDVERFVSKTKIQEKTVIELKCWLAKEITGQFHSAYDVKQAEAEFIKTNLLGGIPSDIKTLDIDYEKTKEGHLSAIELIRYCDLRNTNSEARRLIEQKGVSIDKLIIDQPYQMIELKTGMIIKAGKNKYVRLNYKK